MKSIRMLPGALLMVIAIADPATAAKFSVKHAAGNVDVTNDDANGKLTAFRCTPNNASITVGGKTFSAVFEKDGSVTFNGVNAQTNADLLNLIVQSGVVVTAGELDTLIGMLQSGAIVIEPKKRGTSLLQLLTMWRSRI